MAPTTPVGPLSPTRRRRRGARLSRAPRDVEIGLLQLGTPIFTYSLGEDAPLQVRTTRSRLHVDLSLWLDLMRGQIVVHGFIRVRGILRRRWRTIFARDGDSADSVLAHIDPSVGTVGTRRQAPAPEFDSPQFGRTRPCSPVVLRIHVEDKSRLVCDVGSDAKRRLFPAGMYEDFVFNTVPCVGEPGPQNIGKYTDPDSWWFNLFLGYYQIDVDAEKWERPFGYVSDHEAESAVRGDDLIRLGKADWNWFSNWMYGVPTEAIEPYMTVPDGATVSVLGTTQIGESVWHEVEIENVRVASSYESDAPGAAKLVGRAPLGHAWRDSFGLPRPRPGRTESFFPTSLRAHLYMAYSWEESNNEPGRKHQPSTFHTYMFGATVWADDPQRDDAFKDNFMQAQLACIQSLIESDYGTRGFPLAAPPPLAAPSAD